MRETTARFNEEFATALSWQAVKAHCQCRQFGMGRPWVAYTAEEEGWIAEHAHDHTRAGLARAFAARFPGADKKCRRALPAGEAARRFNARFATRATPGAMYRDCVKYGTKQVGPRRRRTTPRYKTKLKTPRRRWDRRGLREFVILYEAGRAVRAIGRTLKLTPKQCERAMEAAVQLGLIERRAKRRRWSDDELVEVCATHDSDAGVEATAEKLAMSASEIRSALRVARARSLDARARETAREPTTKVSEGAHRPAR